MRPQYGGQELNKLLLEPSSTVVVCLGTTGAITTTTTAAMETILNLTALDIYIRGVARMGAYRLQVTES
jgi:hypothetical protein